jgi:hypothetical protein
MIKSLWTDPLLQKLERDKPNAGKAQRVPPGQLLKIGDERRTLRYALLDLVLSRTGFVLIMPPFEFSFEPCLAVAIGPLAIRLQTALNSLGRLLLLARRLCFWVHVQTFVL